MAGLVQDDASAGVGEAVPSFRKRVASSRALVVDASPTDPFLEKTTFGISFIGGANGSVELGQ